MLQLLDDACLGQPGDAVALFPATFNLELFDALKARENTTLLAAKGADFE